jgi:hypothetical protein
MFRILRKKLGAFDKIVMHNRMTGEYACVIPEYGANVNEIVLRKGGALYSIIDGSQGQGSLVRNKWFKGAKLTPFPNRGCLSISEGRAMPFTVLSMIKNLRL